MKKIIKETPRDTITPDSVTHYMLIVGRLRCGPNTVKRCHNTPYKLCCISGGYIWAPICHGALVMYGATFSSVREALETEHMHQFAVIETKEELIQYIQESDFCI